MITKRNLIGVALIVCVGICAVGVTMLGSSTRAKQYEGMKLVANDLAQNGVEIHTSSNSAFTQELYTSFSVPSNILDEVNRYSIVVKNNTPQSIVSLTVVWRFYPSKGEAITRTVRMKHSDSPTFRDATVGLIKPQGHFPVSLLLSAGGHLSNDVESRKEIKNDKEFQSKLAGLNALLSRSVKWSVDIDGVLFSNGVFVGPDTAKNFDNLGAQVNGDRDLIAEAMQKINIKTPTSEVFANIKVVAAIKDKDIMDQYPDPRKRMTSPEFHYDMAKSAMARRIIGVLNTSGEQAAIDFIKQNAQSQIQVVKK